jgi:ferredoxin
MFELLLYADIQCTDAAEIISRLDAHQHMNNEVKVELIETIQEATPHCPWDAND